MGPKIKELIITPPEGYEIDRKYSTIDCIRFKPKPKKLTYEDVSKALFKESASYYIDETGEVVKNVVDDDTFAYPNTATSEKQLKKLLAINKLMNVQRYLCPDYKPGPNEFSYSIEIDKNDEIGVGLICPFHIGVYFETEELAHKAIKILGKDTLKLALSTDW